MTVLHFYQNHHSAPSNAAAEADRCLLLGNLSYEQNKSNHCDSGSIVL